MIKKVIGSFLINLFSFYVCSQFVLSFHLPTKTEYLFGLIGAFTFVHLILKPLVEIFIKALNFLTFGLIGLVVDVLILYALTIYFPQLSITAWSFAGLDLGSLIIPPREFGAIETMAISAIVINLIRGVLLWIFY